MQTLQRQREKRGSDRTLWILQLRKKSPWPNFSWKDFRSVGWTIASLPSHDAAIGLGLKLPIFLSHAVTSFCEHGQCCDCGGRPQCQEELEHERSQAACQMSPVPTVLLPRVLMDTAESWTDQRIAIVLVYVNFVCERKIGYDYFLEVLITVKGSSSFLALEELPQTWCIVCVTTVTWTKIFKGSRV